MPYRRQRKYYASKRYRKPSKTIAKRVSNLERKLKFAQEVGAVDVTIDSTASFVGAVSHLSPIGQGDNTNNRTGNDTHAKSLQLRWNVVAADSTNMVRVIVFYWKDDTTPTAGDILSAISTGTAPLQTLNFPNKDKYDIIYDRLVTVGTGNLSYAEKVFLKTSRKIEFDGSSSANIANNQLYVMYISDSGAATHPVFQMISRLRYYM